MRKKKSTGWRFSLLIAMPIFCFLHAGYLLSSANEIKELFYVLLLFLAGLMINYIAYVSAIDFDYDSIIEDEINERVEAKLKQIKEAL